MNICTHYGFGDYVVCYGMIRELAKQEPVNLIVIQHRAALHVENVRRLYGNIPNVNIVTDPPTKFDDVVYYGFEDFNAQLAKNKRLTIQKYFYGKAGVPLELLWDNWYFPRDMKREQEVYYDIMGLTDGEQFILLHEDAERFITINRKHVTPNIRIVKPIDYQQASILDMLYTVERCYELHAFNTGLVPFIDQNRIQHDRLFYHKYHRAQSFEQPMLRMKWNIIKKA